ncbi:MAG: transcriptional regulator [Zavarzinella sp.]
MTSSKRKPIPKLLPSEAKGALPDPDRRLRQADRLARVMRMLQLLLSRGRWNVRDIALEQECSERTIYRDMKVLEFAGIPVEFDQNARCYRVAKNFRFPSLNVTVEEALGQGTSIAITSYEGLNISTGAKQVNQKLVATVEEDVAKVLIDAEKLVSVLDLKLADHSLHRNILRTIQWSLVKANLINGTYFSPGMDQEVNLQLHPYRLCLVKQAWYLIARPVDEDTPRTYRVARFTVLQMLDTKAEVPDNFDLKKYFGNAWAVYRGDRSFKVEIVFAKEVAGIVKESIWHHTQKIHEHNNGSLTMTFQVDGLNEIVRWVLGWGSRAKVIQPKELREMILVNLQQSIDAYHT